MSRLLSLAVFVTLAGTACARNAVIDLDVVVPVQPTPPDGRIHAYVEIGTGLNEFDDQVFGLEGATDVDVTAIAGASTRVTYSVVAGDPATQLRVRVRYCRAARCMDSSDMRNFPATEPGVRWEFERAFYAGERTSAEILVPALAPAVESAEPETVCRCAVAGCATVPPGTSSCRGTTAICDMRAPHFCD